MMSFFRGGGFSMWIVLGFGLAAIAGAFGLLRDAEPRRLAAVKALTWGGAFAIVAGLASNLIAVFAHLAREGGEPLALYQGLAESLAPAVLGATMLSVAWLIVAVAVRRGPGS
jgi:hypothetical protein